MNPDTGAVVEIGDIDVLAGVIASMEFVGPDGVVSSAVEYDSFDDFECLATRAGDGTMYWVDREPGVLII